MGISLGEKILLLRKSKGWSQAQLALKANLTRDYVKSIENGENKHPRTDKLLRLAAGLNVAVEELYEAAGYDMTGNHIEPHTETPEELLERLRLAQPITVPVMPDFKIHFGKDRGEPVDYVYLPRSLAPKNIAAYIVHGHCMTPKIEDGDIVIVDSDAQIDAGKIVICLIDDEVVAGRLELVEGQPYIVNNEEKVKITDCKTCAVVIQIIKRV